MMTMRHRRQLSTNPTRHGPVSRGIIALSRRGLTAFDALMIPFHILYASIMLATPTQHLERNPVFRRCAQVAPLWFWAALLIVLALIVFAGIIYAHWLSARVAYIFIAAWWFSIAGLVYMAANNLLSPAVYILIGVVCLYRQAEIAVGYEHGGQ